MQIKQLASLTLSVALSASPALLHSQVGSANTCLVVGVGVWLPPYDGAMWRRSRTITLSSQRVRLPPLLRRALWWRVDVHQELSRGTRPQLMYADRGWLWTAPSDDSLVLLRPAMLSEGAEISGAWIHDTLRGRAVAFSDVLDPHPPRANAFAVRYRCDDGRAAASAQRVVSKLRISDKPDSGANAREDSAEQWVPR